MDAAPLAIFKVLNMYQWPPLPHITLSSRDFLI
jgi:hypothetical protein